MNGEWIYLDQVENGVNGYSKTNWRFKDIMSPNGIAHYKDSNSEQWIDNLCFIKEDGTENLRLKSSRIMFNQLLSKKKESVSTNISTKTYSTGKNIFSLSLDNRFKMILSENGIKITPYIHNLIETDLRERGLL